VLHAAPTFDLSSADGCQPNAPVLTFTSINDTDAAFDLSLADGCQPNAPVLTFTSIGDADAAVAFGFT